MKKMVLKGILSVLMFTSISTISVKAAGSYNLSLPAYLGTVYTMLQYKNTTNYQGMHHSSYIEGGSYALEGYMVDTSNYSKNGDYHVVDEGYTVYFNTIARKNDICKLKLMNYSSVTYPASATGSWSPDPS